MAGRRSAGHHIGTCLLIFCLTLLHVEPRSQPEMRMHRSVENSSADKRCQVIEPVVCGTEGIPRKKCEEKGCCFDGPHQCYYPEPFNCSISQGGNPSFTLECSHVIDKQGEDDVLARDLLACWKKKYSNDAVMKQRKQNASNCMWLVIEKDYRCTTLGKHRIAQKMNKTCNNEITLFSTLNQYDVGESQTPSKEDILQQLNELEDPIDWSQMRNLNAVCALPLRYCKEERLKDRIKELMVVKPSPNVTNEGKGDCECRSVLQDIAKIAGKCDNNSADCRKNVPRNGKRPDLNCGIAKDIGPPCSHLALGMCAEQKKDRVLKEYIEHYTCDCAKIRDYIRDAEIHRCWSKKDLKFGLKVKRGNTLSIGYSDPGKVSKKGKGNGKEKGHVRGRGRGRSEAKFNARHMVVINEYQGPVQDLLELKPYAQILPRGRMGNLTIADVDRNSPMLFVTLPVPKKLALTRQTLNPLPYSQKTKEIADIFASKGCGFVSSINVDTLVVPGLIGIDLAVEMCACSEQDELAIPTKMRVLCEIIETSTRTFEDFMKRANMLCPICFVYMLKQRPEWQAKVLANRTVMDSACDKVGSSFILPSPVLKQWANICTEPSILHARGCRGLRPSLMAYQPSPPSPAHLAVCKDVFCTRLCSLTQDELDVIRHTLDNSQHEDLGCLAYLDGVRLQQGTIKSLVNGSSVPGSCLLRSRLLQRVRMERRQRRKRSCSVTCADIEGDISQGINPPDVIDVVQIQTCLDPQDFSNCTVENDLGDYQWDVEQAKALFNVLRQRESLNTTMFLYGIDLEILGFIGFGFTPEELNTIDGVNHEVYEAFGAAYGWSPEQLRALAQRYLRDNKLQPYELNNVHLARLNHLVCGLSREQTAGIPLKAIENSTPILGAMERCEVEVLEVLARRLVTYNGPVQFWDEDDFSEYGIILAGLKGEELRDVGNRLSDHVTVAIINHIPPVEFRKLTPEQTSMFSYDVSLALSRRGLCAWLTDQHKQGYLEHLCSGVSSVLLSSLVLTSAVVVSTVANCLIRLQPTLD